MATTEDGIWYDERIVSISTGDPVSDAIHRMERAGRDYAMPQSFIVGATK